MAETRSLTTWPARQWKQFLHDYILTGDGAFERYGLYISMNQQSDTHHSAAPLFGFLACVCIPMAFP